MTLFLITMSNIKSMPADHKTYGCGIMRCQFGQRIQLLIRDSILPGNSLGPGSLQIAE